MWLYFNLGAKAICRVPQEVAAGFPTRPDSIFCPDLEKLRLEPPVGRSLEVVSVKFRVRQLKPT